MVYEAKTLADTIRSAWTLTGERLAAAGTSAADGLERPVVIYPHTQQPTQQYTNAIEIIKRTPPTKSDFSTEYFTREEDFYEIRVLHNRESAEEETWDIHESDLEDIENEITRIIKTVFNPLGGVGIFFTSNLVWTDKDDTALRADKPYLHRMLNVTLSRIVPRKTTSFITYKRGVLLDVSESEGSSLPGSDFQYTEVFNVNARQGFKDHELNVTDDNRGVGIPWHYSGAFNGVITMQSYMKSTDLGSQGHKVNTIWQKLSSGEAHEVTILRTFNNANGEVLTISQLLLLLDFQEVDPPHDLLQWNLVGKIIKPGTYTVV